MNWEFHAVRETDSKELMKEFSAYAAESIERWIYTLSLTAMKEKQPESRYEEFPRGFYHDAFSYRVRYRVGFYDKLGYVSMDPPEYDVTVQQTYYPEGGGRKPIIPTTRFRYIDSTGPIC